MAHFEDKIGEKRVLRRDYCIARERGGTLISAEKWNELMNTSEELTMIMLIDRIWSDGASELCPKCGKTSLGTYANQGWLIWFVHLLSLTLYYLLISTTSRRCNTRFRCVGIDECTREEPPESCLECGTPTPPTVTNGSRGSHMWYATFSMFPVSQLHLSLSNCDWRRQCRM